MQMGEAFRGFSRYLPQPIKVLTVFGGVSVNPQMMALRGGADVVVATPGRLLDLADHNAVRLGDVGTLVLDEADRLLDEGFADELTRVLALAARPPSEPAVLGNVSAGGAVARRAVAA